MNQLDDAKSDYSSLERPKQPVLSVGEWMTIMLALKSKINSDTRHAKNPGAYNSYGVFFQKEVDFYLEEIRITQAVYNKLKEAGFSES